MSDDLSDLIAQPPVGGGPRPGFGAAGTPAVYGQGTVLAWDRDTGHNQIRYHGGVEDDVPMILSGDQIPSFSPGDQVAMLIWAPNGGSGVHFILGKLFNPNAPEPAAEDPGTE